MQSARTSASHVILCFNSGSSSVKFALHRLGAVEEVQLAHGTVEYLGIDLDPQKNAVQADVISTPGSACTVQVIPTNEDLMIARHTRTLLVSTAALSRLQTAENRVSI